MRTVVLCVALAAVCLPRLAGAQSTPITEAEALARLSPESPYVRALRAGVELARADVLNAARWPNPRILWDRESVLGTTEHIVTVSQPLPVTGRRRLEVLAAESLASAASNRAEDDVRRARADLRIAFTALAAAQAREQALDATARRLRDLVTILTRREAAGDTAGFDRLRAEREVVEVETERGRAGADRLRAQASLAAFFAENVDPTTLMAASRRPDATPLPDVPALLARAVQTRGDLIALQNEAAAARLAERAAARRVVPEPEIAAGTKSASAGSGTLGSVVSVQASVPLFDRSRPERAMAAARERQAVWRETVLRQTLQAGITALHAEVQARRATASRYRDTAVRTSESISRIAQISYDAGERSILELLDALQTGSTAALRDIELAQAVRKAEIELEFISGWELP